MEALFAIALLAAPARAQVETIRLTYRGDAGCPSENRFVDEVTARIDRTRWVATAEPAPAFVVTVTSEAGGVRGALLITGLDGAVSKREVVGDSCGEVVSALALMTALAIDPLSAVEPPTRLGITGGLSDALSVAPSPVVPDGAAPASTQLDFPSPLAPVAREPRALNGSPSAGEASASRSPRRWRWSAGADGQALAGLVPAWGLGGGPFVDAAGSAEGHLVPSFRASLFVATTVVTFNSAIGAHLDWLIGRLEGCALRFSLAAGLTFVACAAIDAGALQSGGKGLKTNTTEVRAWFAPGAIGHLTWSWNEPFFVELGAGLMVPVTHYSFYYQPAAISGGVVYSIPALGVTAGAGAGYRFR